MNDFVQVNCEKHNMVALVPKRNDYLPACPACRAHTIEMDRIGGMAQAFVHAMQAERTP